MTFLGRVFHMIGSLYNCNIQLLYKQNETESIYALKFQKNKKIRVHACMHACIFTWNIMKK